MVGKLTTLRGVYYYFFWSFVVVKHNNPQYIFVMAPDGQPLMPTLRGGRVRWLLKTGRAKVMKRLPFTIQILDETVGREVQDLTLGLDTGTGNIGASVVSRELGVEYVSETYETNSNSIKSDMEKRAAFRHNRTRFIRNKKKRRAKACSTLRSELQRFRVSGAERDTVAKGIRSSICRLSRFVSNRKLSATAQHILVNHQNIIAKYMKVLPITAITFEKAAFDIHKLVNPDVSGVEYQKGELYGFANVREFTLCRDGHQCVLCNKKKKDEALEVHHVVYRSNGGPDHQSNLVTLHSSCHVEVHQNAKTEAKLHKIIKKKGITSKSVATISATLMNAIMPRLESWLVENYYDLNVSATFGYITKERRFKSGISKSHNNDAFMIACGDMDVLGIDRCNASIYKQFSRNSRSWINGTKMRKYTYRDENGKKVHCYNRNRATAQDEKKLSLADFRALYGKKAISQLTVVKGTQMWIDNSGYHFNKGDTVLYKGELRVVQGNTNGGSYIRLVGAPKTNVKPKMCQLVQRGGGFVKVA